MSHTSDGSYCIQRLLTFEGLVADVAGVWLAFLVSAGYVALQRAFLSETLLAEFAAVGPLACVRAVVFVQARCIHTDAKSSRIWCINRTTVDVNTPGLWYTDCGCKLTLGAKGLAAEVALIRFLSRVRAQVHVQVDLLGEGMIADLAHERTLLPVGGGGEDCRARLIF